MSKKLHGNTLRHAWDTVILLKTAYFKHFEHFPAIEKSKKTNFAGNTVNMCETGHNNLTFTTVEQKIAWKYLEVYLRNSDFALNSLKQPILSILSIFQLLKNLNKQILQQTTVIMCKTGHNNLTFTTVEQKIGWEYLEAYLRYSDFA